MVKFKGNERAKNENDFSPLETRSFNLKVNIIVRWCLLTRFIQLLRQKSTFSLVCAAAFARPNSFCQPGSQIVYDLIKVQFSHPPPHPPPTTSCHFNFCCCASILNVLFTKTSPVYMLYRKFTPFLQNHTSCRIVTLFNSHLRTRTSWRVCKHVCIFVYVTLCVYLHADWHVHTQCTLIPTSLSLIASPALTFDLARLIVVFFSLHVAHSSCTCSAQVSSQWYPVYREPSLISTWSLQFQWFSACCCRLSHTSPLLWRHSLLTCYNLWLFLFFPLPSLFISLLPSQIGFSFFFCSHFTFILLWNFIKSLFHPLHCLFTLNQTVSLLLTILSVILFSSSFLSFPS